MREQKPARLIAMKKIEPKLAVSLAVTRIFPAISRSRAMPALLRRPGCKCCAAGADAGRLVTVEAL